MKKLLLIFCFTLLGYSVFGQLWDDSTVEYFKVGTDTYIAERAQFTMHYANNNNNKSDSTFYYKDGRRAEGTWDNYVPAELNKAGVRRAINETFTASEMALLKNSQTSLDIYCTFDDKGRLVECGFLLTVTPVTQSLAKERFATLEYKLKQYVTTTITDENTKKLKYVYGGATVNLWKLELFRAEEGLLN